MTEIIDGKGLAKKIRENLKKDVDELRKEGIIPKFAGCQSEGVDWFKTCGLWKDRDFSPKAGVIIK